MSLAYVCSCHINPPCSNCVNACPVCEGSGQIAVCRRNDGTVDFIDGQPTDEMAGCKCCDGTGVVERA